MTVVSPVIIQAREEHIADAVAFAAQVREEVMPMFAVNGLSPDLVNFSEHYLHQEGAGFFLALSERGEIWGCIGVQPYDNRIETAKYEANRPAAEIVKCYVAASSRRSGVGSLLTAEAKRFIAEQGYSVAYLHTHRFLKGAVDFWQRQGFAITAEDQDEWQTVHMDASVT
ncbi:GNAT family N-acetyltransferase [Paenibacillus sp. Leaf72]|uniref:GNAT family N-acetyltransferase n=1 Tax=Paenibacillus sp. Leaf72 TaxID=1736234 RepID=UPI0006F471E4|nr:GNAT family N-acetyltransferase [Paenibacillus sp. Leaf72]KQO04283.1 hypothetical protein ASF12_12040 [Paenibacillus sp. Leaf72]